MARPRRVRVELRLPKEVAEYLQALPEEVVIAGMQKWIDRFKNGEVDIVNGDAAEGRAPSLLHRADTLINGDRQQDYGDKLQNFAQTAMLWTAVLAPKLQKEQVITADDVALCMIGIKMARLSKTPNHKDSILDIAGYAGCMDILQNERERNVELLGATRDIHDL